MLVGRSLLPFSLGTFIKHLPTANPSSFSPPFICRLRRKSFSSTATIFNSFHFQTLTSYQQHQVHLYVDSLLQWNQKMNLTAVRELDEVMERHVEDSLAIVPPIRNSYRSHCGSSSDNVRLVDVGSGAGLPGLVLAIACPGWEVTLMESMNKRCVFLEHVISHIGLPNVQVVRGRAENLGQDQCFREKFDVAVARAVAEMRVLAEYCLPLVRVGGLFVAAKGHEPEVEVTNAERAIEMMGASLLHVCSVESHSPHGQRTAVVCLKARPTPKKYPRDPGKMSKSSKAPVFIERRFPGKVTYKSVSVLNKIVEKFSEYNLLERAKISPFKQFFLAPTMKLSSLLIYQILLRKLPSKEYELRFLICRQTLRFGIREFALITCLD